MSITVISAFPFGSHNALHMPGPPKGSNDSLRVEIIKERVMHLGKTFYAKRVIQRYYVSGKLITVTTVYTYNRKGQLERKLLIAYKLADVSTKWLNH